MITMIVLYFGWWILPTIVTLLCLWPFSLSISDAGRAGGGYIDFSGLAYLFSLLWLMPALIAWLIYFIVAYFTK